MSKRDADSVSSGSLRARAVWSTYATRPLLWLWGLALACGTWTAWAQLEQLQTAAVPAFSTATPEAAQEFHRLHLRVAKGPPALGPRYLVGIPNYPNRSGGKPLLPAQAEMLEVYADPETLPELWEPGRFPKVRGLSILHSVNDDQLTRLLELYQPEQLHLNQTFQLTERSWVTLGRTRIKYLDIGWTHSFDEAEALTWPRDLIGLTLNQQPTVRRLQELRTLPALQRITLRCSPWNNSLQLPEEIVAELDQFPQRLTLFLDTAQGTGGAWAVAAARQFRHVAVRPVFAPRRRTFSAIQGLALAMLSLAVGLLHLSGQGLQVSTNLMPGALQPHRIATALFWVLGMIAPTLLMWHAETCPLSALAVCAVGVLVYTLWGSILQREPLLGATGFTHPIMAAVPIMFLPMVGLFFTVGNTLLPTVIGETDWFLRGERPWLAGGICLLGIVCGTRLICRQSTLARSAAEAGLNSVPLSMFDMGGWNQALAPIAGQRLEKQIRWNVFMRIRERRLNALLTQAPVRTQAERVQLWLKGSPLHPYEITLLTLMILVLQTLAYSTLTTFSKATTLEQLTLLIPASQGFGMLLLYPVLMFGTRRKYMAQELLFPVDRQTWRNDWFLVQAWMLVPAVASAVVLPVLALVLRWVLAPQSAAGGGYLPAGLVPGLVSCGVVGLCLAWIISLWLGTYTGFRLILAAALLCTLSSAGVWLLVLVIDLRKETDPSPITLTLLGSIVVTLLGLMVWLMLRRWQTWEVGRA